MKTVKTDIDDLLIVELDMIKDSRGFFVERFNKEKFADVGLPTEFVQDNHSRSAPGTIRGLHYQYSPPQGKLVSAIGGSILDVAVDVRKESPSFGKYFSIELKEDDNKMLWVPAGFAHGFCVTGNKPADVVYKVTSLYNPDGEGGIMWNDKDINVNWPVEELESHGGPYVSNRDKSLSSFSTYMQNVPDWSPEICPA